MVPLCIARNFMQGYLAFHDPPLFPLFAIRISYTVRPKNGPASISPLAALLARLGAGWYWTPLGMVGTIVGWFLGGMILLLEPMIAARARERQATSTGGASPQLSTN